MTKFVSRTIHFYDFESFLFDSELFYEKEGFHSGLEYTRLNSATSILIVSDEQTDAFGFTITGLYQICEDIHTHASTG